jgi:hypothetical protein
MTHPATADSGIWGVKCARQYHGINYVDQHVSVALQAQTGQVRNFQIVFESAPPSTASLNVSSAQATKTADAQLARFGVTGVTLRSVKREVVQPNTFWQTGGSEDPQPGPAKVAWGCYYTVAGNRTTYVVWVDSATGAVAAGNAYSLDGVRATPWLAAASGKR